MSPIISWCVLLLLIQIKNNNLLLMVNGQDIVYPTDNNNNNNWYDIYTINKNSEMDELVKSITQMNINNTIDLVKMENEQMYLSAPHLIQWQITDLLNKKNTSYSIEKNYSEIDDTANDNESEILDNDGFTTDDSRNSRTIEEMKFFNGVQPLDKIEQFIYGLTLQYPNLCHYKSIGTTYEGRNILMVSISKNNIPKSKVVFIQASLHAREWIAQTTALYFIQAILSNYENLDGLLNNIQLIIIPMANPDGFVYSYTKDRSWRKNRQRSNTSTFCSGIDLNRNYDFHFGETGTSFDPCSNTFGGDFAFSALETQALDKYLRSFGNRLKAFVDLHSFGGYIFYPYGYLTNTYYQHDQHRKLAQRIANRIKKVRGTNYRFGTAANLIYESAGGSDDYAAGKLNVPIVYTFELPTNSFIVNSSDIRPIGRETTAGLLVLIKAVKKL